MMTVEQFKKATSQVFCGRGLELRAIDEALGAVNPPSPDSGVQKQRLLNLIMAINIWFNAKAEKHGDGASSLYLKRKQVLEEMREEAFKLIASSSFAANKQRGAVLGAKGLEAGYSFERADFVDMKRGVGAGFSGVVPGASVVSEGSKKGKMLAPGQHFDSLTRQEYDAIWTRLNTMGLENPTQQKLQVHLIRKEERISKFLAWLFMGKFYKQESMPYTSDAKGIEIYAMDRYGNMITMPSALEFRGDVRGGTYVRGVQAGNSRDYRELAQHNHSSLNAGNDVISAGVIKIAQGVVTYIDNASGHYKPTPLQLQRCVRVLHEEGADLSQLTVSAWTTVAGAGATEAKFPNAATFLSQRY